ncbi:MAG: FIG01964566: Predicted membrane protein, hemolysin III homolog, partial [uncultured Pseudonocardia sp.]
ARRDRCSAPRARAAGQAPPARLVAPLVVRRVHRGVGRAHLRVGVPRGRRGGVGHHRVLHHHPRAVRHERALPPPHLAHGAQSRDHETRRPLDDLPVHRRHLHAGHHPDHGPGPGAARAHDRLGGRARRGRAEDGLAARARLGRGAGLPRPGLRRRLRHPRPAARWRGRRAGADPGRRPALHHRRDLLRDAVAEPVARDVRVPRVLPRGHGAGRDLPPRRDLAGAVL